jgi:predicted nucleic acid-binding protein
VTKYILDTNLYIRAFRSQEGKLDLQQFLSAFAPSTYLSSVVAHELLVGAKTDSKARDINASIVEPLRKVGRLITPTHAAWTDSAGAIARMARKENRSLRSIPKSLVHDYLLAASCREGGTTLITENVADFKEVRRYLRFEYVQPWPK